jgi:hypothetical protein
MPPAQSQPPTIQSPNQDYNFIFSDQKPKKGFNLRLPGGNSLTKLAVLIVGGGAILGILIIVASSFFGPKINTKELTDVIARAQEISRVSDTVVQQSHDLNTTNLASTTSAALTSQEQQLLDYLKKNGKKVTPKDAALYKSSKTDGEVTSADQNNRLSEYYYSYLKKNLTDYEAAIKTAYNTAGGPVLKSDLNGFSISTTTLLSAKQLATAQ